MSQTDRGSGHSKLSILLSGGKHFTNKQILQISNCKKEGNFKNYFLKKTIETESCDGNWWQWDVAGEGLLAEEIFEEKLE